MRKEEIALCTLTVSAIFDHRRNSNGILANSIIARLINTHSQCNDSQNNCEQLSTISSNGWQGLRTDIALFNSVLVWNMSLMFTLTGKSSVLVVSYFPAIDLSDGDYEFDLTDFETYYILASINSTNNKFYYAKQIGIPEGSNCDIEWYLNVKFYVLMIWKARRIKSSGVLIIHANNNTMRNEIKCAYRINFAKP